MKKQILQITESQLNRVIVSSIQEQRYFGWTDPHNIADKMGEDSVNEAIKLWENNEMELINKGFHDIEEFLSDWEIAVQRRLKQYNQNYNEHN